MRTDKPVALESRPVYDGPINATAGSERPTTAEVPAQTSPVSIGNYSNSKDQSSVQASIGRESVAIGPEGDEAKTGRWAPSFECSNKMRVAETMICSSRALSEADVKMATLNRALLRDSSAPSQLREEQRVWRVDVRDSCQDVQCMLRAYQLRVSDLLSK